MLIYQKSAFRVADYCLKAPVAMSVVPAKRCSPLFVVLALALRQLYFLDEFVEMTSREKASYLGRANHQYLFLRL